MSNRINDPNRKRPDSKAVAAALDRRVKKFKKGVANLFSGPRTTGNSGPGPGGLNLDRAGTKNKPRPKPVAGKPTAPAKTPAPPKPAASSGSGTKGKTRVPYVAGTRRSPPTGKASPGKSTRSPTQKQMLKEQMKGLEGSGSKPKKKSTVKKATPKVVTKKAAPKAVAKKTTGPRGTKKSVTLLSPAQAKQRKDELMKKAVAAGRKKSTAKKKRSRLKPTKTGYASYKSFMGK
jgi:hypothetical protein